MEEPPVKSIKLETPQEDTTWSPPKRWVTNARTCTFIFTQSDKVYTLSSPSMRHTSSKPILFNPLKDVRWKEIIVGHEHFFGFSQNNEVYTWGSNTSGQLGLGESFTGYINELKILEPPSKEKWKEIVSGDYHSFGITGIGDVYAWGCNSCGQLGLEGGENKYSPSLLKPPEGEKWKSVVTGTFHSFGFTQNEKVYAWGSGSSGQLGLGDQRNQSSPRLLESPSGDKWVRIVPGDGQSYGFTRNGKMYAWGSNLYGMLGVGVNDFGEFKGPNAVTTPLILDPPSGEKWKDLVVGTTHVLSLTESGKVFVWGDNVHGQLGLDHIKGLSKPNLLKAPSEDNWEYMVAGENCSFGYTQKGKLFAWGSNKCGQLGIPFSKCTEPVLVMPPSKEEWRSYDKGALLHILFIARYKEPNSGFYGKRLPMDLFKLISSFF